MKKFENLMQLRYWVESEPSDSWKAGVYEHVFQAARDGHMALDYEKFAEYFGGDVFVCEEIQDLQLIDTCATNDATNKWYTLLEHADAFDAAEVIPGGHNTVFIMLCTNNDGGHSYYIPNDVAVACANVALSIEMTKKAWAGNADNKD